MPIYDADKFAEWLTGSFERSNFKSYAALADAASLSRSSISALAGAKKQPLTDKPSQPKPETVINLATALDENIDLALHLAGYAPIGEQEENKYLNTALRFGNLPANEKERLSALFEFLDKEIAKIEEKSK